MKLRHRARALPGAIFILTLMIAGCKPTPPVDVTPADTSASLVAKLATLHATIEQGVASDDHEAIHDPLHTVMATLRSLATVEDANLPAATLNDIHAAAEAMAAAYGKLDEAMHGGDEPEYSEVEGELADNLARLQTLTSTP